MTGVERLNTLRTTTTRSKVETDAGDLTPMIGNHGVTETQ